MDVPFEQSQRFCRACLAALALGLVAAGPACVAVSPPSAEPPVAQHSSPVDFSFPAVEGENVSSESTRGRVTVLAFVTTYDMVSQVVVRRLSELIVKFTPRANAAAVVLEAPRYADLLPAYRDALALPFPVVMADYATQQGSGYFGNIQTVPVLIILDREGREVWRHQGPLDPGELEDALKKASQR